MSRIIAIILAIVCMASVFSSCDFAMNDVLSGKRTPETPREYYEYAFNYMQTHAYKQTTTTTSTMNGETYTDDSASVSHMDGTNYCSTESGMAVTYYDGTIYVETATGKRKMKIDIWSMGESYGFTKDYWSSVDEMITDDDIKLTKNDDGTATLEFSVTMLDFGDYDYVVTLDKDNRIVEYIISTEMTVMDYTVSSIDKIVVEYGDQYKVSKPEDADSYEVVNSYYDLVK